MSNGSINFNDTNAPNAEVGVPGFWLKCLKNTAQFGSVINKKDEEEDALYFRMNRLLLLLFVQFYDRKLLPQIFFSFLFLKGV